MLPAQCESSGQIHKRDKEDFFMSLFSGRNFRGTLLLVLAVIVTSGPVLAQGDGATLFKSKCAGCHSADGSGTGPAGKAMHLRALGSADVQKQTDAQLAAIIADGKSPMPAFKDKFTSDQIKQLVAFIRSLAKKG